MSDTVKQSEIKVVDGVIYTGGQTLPEKKKAAAKPAAKTEADNK